MREIATIKMVTPRSRSRDLKALPCLVLELIRSFGNGAYGLRIPVIIPRIRQSFESGFWLVLHSMG